MRSLLRTMAGNAAGARAWLAEQDKTNLVLERSDNATGFKNVIKLARGGYQVKPYDSKLKRPRPLPGVWATAEEAAQYYACAKKLGIREMFYDVLDPPLQRKQRGSTGVRACPARTHALASLRLLVCSDLVAPVVKTKPAKKKPRGRPFQKKQQPPASPQAEKIPEDAGPSSPQAAHGMEPALDGVPITTQLSPRSLQASKKVQVLAVVPN